MKWWPETCSSGDMIRVRVGAIWHYGIFVSDDEVIEFGPPPVDTATAVGADHKIMAVPIEDFAAGGIVERAIFDRDEQKKRIPPKKTVALARSRIGEGGYNLIHNNCEHFAYSCVFGIEHSSQEMSVREKWLNRPLLDVYVMQIPQDLTVCPVYPPVREQLLQKTTNEDLKRQRFAVWQLLEKAAHRSFNLKMEDITFSVSKGKWSCDKFQFSLSHTRGAVAVVVSNDICGVDLEPLSRFYARREDPTFLQRFVSKMCTSQERELVRDLKDMASLWTKKESLFKCYGSGGFFSRKIDSLAHACKTEVIGLDEPYILSACGSKLEKARLFIVEDGTARQTSFEKERVEA